MEITAEILSRFISRESFGDVAPRIVCESGFSLSVQAGESPYSEPRVIGADYYSEVEVGFPSSGVADLMPYAEEPERPTRTVYGWVPIQVVVDLINRHGGPSEAIEAEILASPRCQEVLEEDDMITEEEDTGQVNGLTEYSYSHNNSGGFDWLNLAQWKKLEAAGWDIDWRDESDHSQGAYGADKSFPTHKDAVDEWTYLTGENINDIGCECCGMPHAIY